MAFHVEMNESPSLDVSQIAVNGSEGHLVKQGSRLLLVRSGVQTQSPTLATMQKESALLNQFVET